MQRITTISLLSFLLVLASCTQTAPGDTRELAAKKAKLENLKKQQASVTEEITKLENDIAKTDPSAAREEKPKLVSVTALNPGSFIHNIDLQGRIDAQDIAYVTPRNGVGGQVKAVYVKKGDYVSKGKLLLKLDDAVVRKQIQQAQTQLDYAKNIYQRRQNLWNEKIGTEVELINAKNSVDQAQRQMDILNEQLSYTNVVADMSGVADDVTIRVGEFFTGNPQTGYIKLVNTSNLKVIAQVPENYLGKVKEGDNVQVGLPDINRTINARISLTGKVIDPGTRSFYIEVRLPSDRDFHPNQVALVKIQDYASRNAITVPVNTVQTDEKGKFVMTAVQEGGKLRARKRTVTPGEIYEDKIEILKGLNAGDQVVTDGFQNLYDGQLLTIK